MSEVRHYTDVMKVNGRPALVRIDEHPSGRRIIDGSSIEYLDEGMDAELRAKLDKSPAPGIGLGLFVAIALLGLVMACLSQPLSGGVFFGALLAAVGVAGVFRILHVNTGRNR